MPKPRPPATAPPREIPAADRDCRQDSAHRLPRRGSSSRDQEAGTADRKPRLDMAHGGHRNDDPKYASRLSNPKGREAKGESFS